MIKQYFVTADPDTGEWLTAPQYVKEVDQAQWDEMKNTPQIHRDTYEVEVEGDGPLTETRAIEVRWEN